MRTHSQFSTLVTLLIVLTATLFGHGWGQAQALVPGTVDRGQLFAPVADEVGIRPDAARVAQSLLGDETPDLPPAPNHCAPAFARVVVAAISIHSQTLGPAKTASQHAPRAPPFT